MAIKTVLLMAQTLDGKIAKHANHFPDWTGKTDKQLFVRETRRAGAIIMGSKTFDTIGKPLPGRRNIVMTRNASRVSRWENLIYTSRPPKAILEQLQADGFARVVIAGGARINTLFAYEFVHSLPGRLGNHYWPGIYDWKIHASDHPTHVFADGRRNFTDIS